jgi:hypothetical protein
VAGHVEVRLLLAGEAGVRQILGGGAAANSHVHRSAFAEPVVGIDDGLLQVAGQRGTSIADVPLVRGDNASRVSSLRPGIARGAPPVPRRMTGVEREPLSVDGPCSREGGE